MTMHSSSRLPLLAVSAALAVMRLASNAAAFDTCCGPEDGASWVFAPSTYTHDPMTGARVAQYARKPPVEPLEDERNVTSSYRGTRTNIRGADGSTDTYYQVQAWGNGRGGLDAEWERFHDAWKESTLSGGYYSSQGGPYGHGQGDGYGNPGYGYGGWGQGNGGPGWGNGPGPGNWNGPPNGWGGPGNGGPPGGGNQWGNGPNGPPQGNGQNDSDEHDNFHHGWGHNNGDQNSQSDG
jgi:hypothetical protein